MSSLSSWRLRPALAQSYQRRRGSRMCWISHHFPNSAGSSYAREQRSQSSRAIGTTRSGRFADNRTGCTNLSIAGSSTPPCYFLHSVGKMVSHPFRFVFLEREKIVKSAVLIVLLFVGFFVAIDYLSKGTMAGIESGFPEGGSGKFAAHKFPSPKENPVVSYFSNRTGSADSGVGAVTENPYSE